MMPAFINLPTEHRGAYRPATVVAAIPLEPRSYAVVAIHPGSLLARPDYFAAKASRAQADAPWYADECENPSTLEGALCNMVSLAGEVHPWVLGAPEIRRPS